MTEYVVAQLNRCPRLAATLIRKMCSKTWPMPGALLFFGCGKLWLHLQYPGRDTTVEWMEEFLTDIALMGSLLGAVRFVVESKWVVSMAMVVYGLTRVHRDAVMSIKQTLTVDLLILTLFLFPVKLPLKHIAGKSAAVKAGESVFMSPLQLLMKSIAGKPPNVKHEKTLKSIKGLRNLGNTCYFNAIMQNIYWTEILAKRLTEMIERNEHVSKAPITRALVNFYKDMSKPDDEDTDDSFFGSGYNPSQLFNALCRRSPRFLSGKQQDSYEVLRHLMDGVKEEHQELIQQQQASATASGLPTDVSPLTVVDSIFGGHYLTIFHCKHCQMPYHLFEPFLDISLPIAFEDEERKAELAAAAAAAVAAAAAAELVTKSQYTEWQAVNGDDADVEAAEEKDANKPAATAAEPASEQTAENADEQFPIESVGESEAQTQQDSFSKDSDDDEQTASETADSVKKAECCAEYKEYVVAVGKVRERLKNTTERPKDNSLLNSLRFYTREEHLDEYFCLTCNEGLAEPAVRKGTKQTLIFNPPAVLTIHLRRFEQSSRGYVKVAQHIAFEEYLDLAPYCTRFAWRQQPAEDAESFMYRLYGVVVHGGSSLESGHYTACVRLRTVHVDTATTFLQKTFLDRRRMMSKEQLINLIADDLPRERVDDEDQWFDISDTSVHEINRESVFEKEAYLLFYERLS